MDFPETLSDLTENKTEKGKYQDVDEILPDVEDVVTIYDYETSLWRGHPTICKVLNGR